jgi:Ca2+-binding EF-hand superfamily protein
MFDRGKQGYIMATQIGQVMQAMEQDFDEKTLRKLVAKYGAAGSGKLEFEKFCALVYTVANTVDKETLEKELREAFRLFDKEVESQYFIIKIYNFCSNKYFETKNIPNHTHRATVIYRDRR